MASAIHIPIGRVPVPDHVRLLLILGGTFDPPHRAHIELPILARDAVNADWLLYIPAARSPHKSAAPEANDGQRLDMLSAALQGEDRVSISTIELEKSSDRAGDSRAASYTIETLRELRDELPPYTQMRLLIGADQALEFHRWKDPKAIMSIAPPLVMLRGGKSSRAALVEGLTACWSESEVEDWKRRFLTLPTIDSSASRVRELLHAQGPSHPEALALVPKAVLAYIARNGLYPRTEPVIETAPPVTRAPVRARAKSG